MISIVPENVLKLMCFSLYISYWGAIIKICDPFCENVSKVAKVTEIRLKVGNNFIFKCDPFCEKLPKRAEITIEI